MKTFMKIALWIAGILAGVGVICMILAFSMGLTGNQLKQMVRDGKFSFDLADEWEDHHVENQHGYGSHHISDSCRALDVKFGAGVLEIVYGDVTEIQVEQQNIEGLQVEVQKGTLYISGNKNVDVDVFIGTNNFEDRYLKVTLPKNCSFEEVDLEIGASRANINGLMANDMEIVVGAGQADIMDVTAKNLDLKVGAGEVNVYNLIIDNLETEVGLGEVNFEVCGKESDYNYNVECGMGEVVVGTRSYGGVGAKQNVMNNNAVKSMEIECGMGKVSVAFKEIL